jgi:hypothetical protein
MAPRSVVAGLLLGVAILSAAALSSAVLRNGKPRDVGALTPAVHLQTATPAVVLSVSTSKPCSPDAVVAATYIVPPAPFRAQVISVREMTIPTTSIVAVPHRGPLRLFMVTFVVVVGNPVLPAGHRYTQFAYVDHPTPEGRWCFVAGGSGP